jgi:hypothetical protein
MKIREIIVKGRLTGLFVIEIERNKGIFRRPRVLKVTDFELHDLYTLLDFHFRTEG